MKIFILHLNHTYHNSLVYLFSNISKSLELTCKADLDFCELLQREKHISKHNFMTNLDIWGHSRNEKKTLFYSQINTVSVNIPFLCKGNFCGRKSKKSIVIKNVIWYEKTLMHKAERPSNYFFLFFHI